MAAASGCGAVPGPARLTCCRRRAPRPVTAARRLPTSICASGATLEQLEGLETLAIVCLDGLDRVAGDTDWNAAIFRAHTLMQDARSRLIVATQAAPATLTFALADLRSRLLAAEIFQLRELDDEGLLMALQLRARQRGLELSDEGAEFLLRRLPRDMHTLCTTLDQLDYASLAAQRRLTLPFLREALADRSSADDG